MDRRKGNKIVTSITFMVCFAMMLTAGVSEAFDPKLLWEKQFDCEHLSAQVARISGDVLVLCKDKREVTLYNKEGKEISHWGPRIDRVPTASSISDDGKYYAFSTGWTYEYAFEKGILPQSDDRVHLYSRNGKELWNVEDSTSTTIAPNGTYILHDADSIVFISDMEGKFLLQTEELGLINQPDFEGLYAISPDSEFFVMGGYVIDEEYYNETKIALFNRAGVELWRRNFNLSVTSISDGAQYIAIYPYSSYLHPETKHNGVVYDKKGEVFLKGYAYVSGGSTKAAVVKEIDTEVISLPEKAVLKKLSVKTTKAIFSHNGEYLAIFGQRTDVESENNLFIYDLVNDKRWETKADFEFFKSGGARMTLTRDGKYLAGQSEYQIGKGTKVSYYRIYTGGSDD